ncbi:MAG: HAD family phosphatase [Patescibacteria group bacterium]
MGVKNAEKIKAVIFDWAGVFCSPGELFSHPALATQTGLNVDEMGEQTASIQHAYYTGTINSKEFWEQSSNLLGPAGLSETELRDAYLASYRIYPEMLGLALNLKQKYKTLLLSNLTAEMTEDIKKKYGVKKYFHHAIFSNEVGLMKPDPKIFELAVEKINIPIKNIVFIDDSQTNIKVAEHLGFHIILFKNPTQCRQELRDLGVTII